MSSISVMLNYSNGEPALLQDTQGVFLDGPTPIWNWNKPVVNFTGRLVVEPQPPQLLCFGDGLPEWHGSIVFGGGYGMRNGCSFDERVRHLRRHGAIAVLFRGTPHDPFECGGGTWPSSFWTCDRDGEEPLSTFPAAFLPNLLYDLIGFLLQQSFAACGGTCTATLRFTTGPTPLLSPDWIAFDRTIQVLLMVAVLVPIAAGSRQLYRFHCLVSGASVNTLLILWLQQASNLALWLLFIDLTAFDATRPSMLPTAVDELLASIVQLGDFLSVLLVALQLDQIGRVLVNEDDTAYQRCRRRMMSPLAVAIVSMEISACVIRAVAHRVGEGASSPYGVSPFGVYTIFAQLVILFAIPWLGCIVFCSSGNISRKLRATADDSVERHLHGSEKTADRIAVFARRLRRAGVLIVASRVAWCVTFVTQLIMRWALDAYAPEFRLLRPTASYGIDNSLRFLANSVTIIGSTAVIFAYNYQPEVGQSGTPTNASDAPNSSSAGSAANSRSASPATPEASLRPSRASSRPQLQCGGQSPSKLARFKKSFSHCDLLGAVGSTEAAACVSPTPAAESSVRWAVTSAAPQAEAEQSAATRV